jgi:hypothetical protein
MPKNLTPNHFDRAGIYVEGERSVRPFKKPVLASFMSGMLVPLGDPIPVFPGVKLDLNIDAVIRSNTMIVPPLDGIYIDFFTVWVPHRIVWNHHPQFLGENDSTAWTQSASYVYPYETYYNLNSTLSTVDPIFDQQDVSLANIFLAPHYGLLYGILAGGMSSSLPVANKHINVLSFRGYYSIWNYLFRDENYQRPVLFSKGDTGSAGEFGYFIREYDVNSQGDGACMDFLALSIGDPMPSDTAVLMPVNKFHDAFTSVLPQAQFDNGSGVSLPLGNKAPIFIEGASSLAAGTDWVVAGAGNGTKYMNLTAGAGKVVDSADYTTTVSASAYTDLSLATAATINELRNAVMTQRYLEALARGGRRVVEYYSTIYGVNDSHATKDYPELVSRARYMLNVNQVVAQADSSGSGWTSHLGDTGAYSLTHIRDIPCCEKDFTEFGYLHILYCVRADNRYSQIIQPHFLKQELLEEYNPFFDHIGDVDIDNVIVNTSAGTGGNFGFQEAWWDERTQLAMAVGALNKNYGSLSYWILGERYDQFTTSCTPGFLTFDPGVFNDIFVSPYYTYPQFIIDGCIRGTKVARMSAHSIPGIVGRI